MALKKIDALQTPKTRKPPQKWQRVNPLGSVVTSDEQFEEILAEAQKKEEVEKEKREKRRNRKKENRKNETSKNFNEGNKKNKALKEENYQQKKILTIMVRNLRIQRPAIQSGMKM